MMKLEKLEMLEALLTVTVALDVTSRFKGGWALHGLMADLGIAMPARKGLADHLVAMRKYDMMLRDVEIGPRHELHKAELERGVHAFYAALLDSLPPSMLVAN